MLNRLEVIGNLGREPEMTYTPGGKAVAKFSVAVNQKRSGGETETLWLNVVAWERLAEICSEYLHKGAKVFLAGRLQVREYERKEGGKGISVELVASDMVMLDTKRTEGEPVGAAADAGANDIPF